ncbi:MAG: indolepyruvate oxidoreductase subunit beta [Deltaproteobacteria bacterium]|nr:indolepyruvate oxidoreductase subunit beta [Deltaproteobacteria bacterium]
MIRPDPFNLIVSGIGGQGNILLSRIVGRLMFKAGYYVNIGETFGAAQRGGSVFSAVRISKKRIYGPIVPDGHANAIISLEALEALRVLSRYGNPKVAAVVNTEPIYPVAVLSRRAEYPGEDDIRRAVSKASGRAFFFNATRMALDLGAPIVVNIVMLGGLVGVGLLPLEASLVEEEIKTSVPGSKTELNLTAFRKGISAVAV